MHMLEERTCSRRSVCCLWRLLSSVSSRARGGVSAHRLPPASHAQFRVPPTHDICAKLAGGERGLSESEVERLIGEGILEVTE